MRRGVAGNVIALVGARGVAAFAGLLSVPVVLDRLGPTAFGVWTVLAGMATIALLADLGLGSAIVREVASGTTDPTALDRTRLALGLGLVWGVALAAIGTLVVLVAWGPISSLLNLGSIADEAEAAALVLMIGVLADGVSLPWRGSLEGTQRYRALSWINALSAVVGAGLAVVAVVSGGGLVALAATVAATAVARAAAMIVTARRESPELQPRLRGGSRDDLRAIGRYGTRVQVTTASGAVNLEVDRFVLAGYAGPAAAGGFELGAKLVNLWRIVPVFALVALFPMAASRAAELGASWLDEFDVAVTKYLTAFAAVGAAALVVCADPLIRLWLGEPNTAAVACITILAPAYAINLVSGSTGILSRVEDRPGRETRYAVISMVVNIAATWPLVVLFGANGVPLATAVGIVVGTVHFVITYHTATARPLGPVVRVIWPPMVAAVVAGTIGFALRALVLPAPVDRLSAALVVAGAASCVILVAAALLGTVRFVSRDDIARLRALSSGSPAATIGGTDAVDIGVTA